MALELEEWEDAFKTCQVIYKMMNKQKSQAYSKKKQVMADFYQHLAKIFWKSDYVLFHAYAFSKLQNIIKSNPKIESEKKGIIASEFVMATLAIPLNVKVG